MEIFIGAVAEAGSEMVLPSGIPTHLYNISKCWSRLDNVFLTDHSIDMLISCNTLLEQCGVCTDHLPILTKLDLLVSEAPPKAMHNFREVDWEQFCNTLEAKLSQLSLPSELNTQAQLDKACMELTNALQETISTNVPITTICAKSKRWWTKELTLLHKKAKKLGRESYKHRDKPFHYVHAAHTDTNKLYHRTLESTKKQHWWDWLENAEDPNIWTVQKLLAAPASDGGNSKIPALKYKISDMEYTAKTNEKKGRTLAKSFFPSKLHPEPPAADDDYPPQCSKADKIPRAVVLRQL